MLRVHLAGSLALESDGREIALPASRRARALLAYLAAHPGPHARGELAARFWPDVLDESARTSLRAALSELRRALGHEAGRLAATRESVALDGAWVDLRECRSLLDAGRVDAAAAVCEGELLRGMDDDWVFELRREHADRLRAAGADRAAAAIEAPAVLDRDELFVGRTGELARLRAAWRTVRDRRARRLVLLAGEPGVGKTRLALRFASEAREATVLLGRCSEDPLAAFEPFTDVLRHVGPAAARALAGPGSGELDRLLGGARRGPDADAGARHRLFAAVDDVLTGIAERRPLVLLLDDLHWADRPTLLLLSFVLRSGRPAPLLVIGTYRDTEVGRRTPLAAALADLRRDGGAERIGLRGLAPDEVGELATAWLGPDAAARVAGAVHARTGGNAFFVEEVLRGLAADDASVPESVRHAVGARLARLSPEADELLAVAAVLGLAVDAELLASVAGRPPAEVEPLLDELFDARLLLAGEGRALEFPHALVREAVDRDLNPLRRARLHRSAAEALIARGEERHLAEIAHHLCEAADDRAPAYLRRAGEEAMAMLAYEEAAAQFERALEATPEARSGPLLLARGDALLRAGEPALARACFERAAALARRANDPVLLGRAALGHAGLGVTIIDLDARAIALLEEALSGLGDREPVLRSELLARLAVELYYAPSRDRSEAVSSEAVAVARSAGDRRAVAAALNARHVALWRPDRLAERLATADEMLAVADEPHVELQARNWRVVDLFEALEMDEWRAEVERHGRLAERMRMPAYTWYTPLWAAVEAVHAGRWEEAAALRETAHEQGSRAGDRNAGLFAEMLRFDEVIMRGTWESLDLELLQDKIANSPAGMAWRSSYAWMLAATGRADAAREQYAIIAAGDFAALPFDVNWPSAMGELASACIELGDPELAAPIYERLLPYADRALTAGRAISSFGSTQRLLGALAALLGRTAEARDRLEEAIRVNEATGFIVWAEQARHTLATLTPTFSAKGR
jgi:tetratricopeptide (TPR) repeat protein